MNTFINPLHIRRDDQKKVMDDIAKEGHCPFCEENLLKYHKKPIIQNGRFWILTENQWPYEKIKHQLLVIYKKHIEHITEIEAGAGEELLGMLKDESIKRNIPGGGVAIRFGDNSSLGTYGNTVKHLHAHLVEPDLSAMDPGESWKFKFGQRNKAE